MKKVWDKNSEEYREHRREIARKSQQKRRALAREYGMCIHCIYTKAIPGKVLCASCAEKQKLVQRRYNNSTKQGDFYE